MYNSTYLVDEDRGWLLFSNNVLWKGLRFCKNYSTSIWFVSKSSNTSRLLIKWNTPSFTKTSAGLYRLLKLLLISKPYAPAFAKTNKSPSLISFNFNSRYKPAEVLVKDGAFHLIRRRDVFEDLLTNQIEVL